MLGVDFGVLSTIVAKDLRAVRRSPAVVWPMLLVPTLLLVVLPLALTALARRLPDADLSPLLDRFPATAADTIRALPPHERLIVLVDGYLMAPMFLIVPLMVSAVLAADAFAGEKERKTLESLLHLPVSDHDLFIGKVLGAFLPAVLVAWAGFGAFVVVVNAAAWSTTHRMIVPTSAWALMIGWIAPGVATFGLGVMVRVSARTRTAQEANQLGGAVILPLIFLALGQATALLFVPTSVGFVVGAVVWVTGLWLLRGGVRRFTRDRLAADL